MSNESLRARRIDDAIDDAVRNLVQVDPLPGLRFRVLARLERPPRGGGGGWLPSLAFIRGSWEPVAAVAIVGIALAIFVPQFFRGRSAEPAPQNMATRNVITPPPAAPVARPDSPPQTAAARMPSATAPSIAPAAAVTTVRRRASEPTPESIFGARTDRVGAASVNALAGAAAVPAAGEERPESEPQFTLRPLAPLQPISVTPITIPPISLQPIR